MQAAGSVIYTVQYTEGGRVSCGPAPDRGCAKWAPGEGDGWAAFDSSLKSVGLTATLLIERLGSRLIDLVNKGSGSGGEIGTGSEGDRL